MDIKKGNATAQVEIIAEKGLQWIKLSNINSKKMMHELAKAGWEGSSEISGDYTSGQDKKNDDADAIEWNKSVISQVPLMQSAKFLISAAKSTWVNYQHPNVVFQLRNLHMKDAAEPILQLVKELEDIGVKVEFADYYAESSPINPIPSIEQLIGKIQREHTSYTNLTNTINVDCTILLALASDISNSCVDPKSRHFNQAILHQLRNEMVEPLLTSAIFPALRNHKLMCTPTARNRFEAIVDEIGTASEKARYKALIDASGDDARGIYQQLCIYKVPEDFHLPIRVIGEEEECWNGPPASLPYSSELTGILSPINASVFLTGWSMEVTTITSNMNIAKIIQDTWTREMAKSEDRGYGVNLVHGPKVCLIRVARSLAGKGPSGSSSTTEQASEEGTSGPCSFSTGI